MSRALHERSWLIRLLWITILILVAGTIFKLTEEVEIQKTAVPTYQASWFGTISPLTWKGASSVVTSIYTQFTDADPASVAWSPDGKSLAMVGPEVSEEGKYDSTVQIKDYPNGAESPILLSTDQVSWITDIAWSPDGKLLAASTFDDQTFVWTVSTGQVQDNMPGSGALAWSPDSRKLATGNDEGWVDVYDLSGQTPIQQVHQQMFSGLLSSNAWSSDGKSIISASYWDNHAIILNARSGQEEYAIQTTSGSSIRAAAWSPDGKWIAIASSTSSSSDPGSVEVWSTRDHTVKQYAGSSNADNPFSYVESLSFSPDSKALAGGNGDGTWVMKGGAIQINEGHQGSNVTGVAWSPDGKLLASVGEDLTAQVWAPQL